MIVVIINIENIDETQGTYHIITERFNNYFVNVYGIIFL